MTAEKDRIMSQPIIQVKDLSKRFGEGEDSVLALSHVDLTVNKGDIYGIIGLSGAGKSTLVRCINLLERPTEGEVIVDGLSLTSMKEKELRETRKSIGMIFQGFNLLMQKNAIENICFPLYLQGMSKKDAYKRARELLKTVGLSDREKAYPSQLSGGQKQRIAIARAVANNPKVLLCDEATSALDPNTTSAILELLREINEKTGVTIVIITHEMKVIERICNRVAVIDKSEIVEEGEVKDIFTNPKSDIAKQLIRPRSDIMPKGQGEDAYKGGKVIRLTFAGGTSYEPLVATLAIELGVVANILGADTRDVGGKAYGTMLLGLPADKELADKAIEYISKRENVTYEEVGENA